MANEMTTTALAKVINTETIQEARLAFQQNANLPPLVRVADITGETTAQATFPVFLVASVTKPGSETTDVTTNSDITPTAVGLTVVRRTVRIQPSDLGMASSTENMSQIIGRIIGEARAKQVDTDICAVMTTNYTSSVGATNATTVTFANINSALLVLESNEANQNLGLVLHPKQWAHLRKDLVIVSGTDTRNTDRSVQGQNTLTTGYVGNTLFGAQVIVTPRVGVGSDTNDMYLGFMGNLREALGYAFKNVNAAIGLPEIELDRDPATASTKIVHNYYDKAGIIRAAGLVLIKSQTY